MPSDLNASEASTTSSSSEEEEDENAKEWTEEVEKTFLKTLCSLKSKDPKIYDKDTKFFKENLLIASKRPPAAPRKETMYLKDYERKIILEKGGILTDEESDEESAHRIREERSQSPTYVEEQKILKENFKKLLHNEESSDDDNGGSGFLKVKQKSAEQKAKEEEEYIEWLKGQKEEIGDKETEKDLKHLRDYWTDPKLNEGEQFIRDYVLNKRYMEADSSSQLAEEVTFSEEEKILDECDQYEEKYNFRFEEPDKNFIKTYPRVIESSLRRKEEKRKLKREALKKRKEEEFEQKRIEIKQLKKRKKQELLEKIKNLKEITGNARLGFDDEDLEKDFNPDEYDQKMSQLFNEEFYELDDADDVKPTFDTDSEYEYEYENDDYPEASDDADTKPPQMNDLEPEPSSSSFRVSKFKRETRSSEDEYENDDYPEASDDADTKPPQMNDLEPEPSSSSSSSRVSKFKRETRSSRKKGHKKSKLMESVEKVKPVFNAEDKTFQEYLDEYYALDFEDIVGDTVCRFKYRKTTPNSFGLTVDEILAADDKELNNWCSMKKIDSIRPENVEKFELKTYAKKGTDVNLKKKLLPSLFQNEYENNKAATPSGVPNDSSKKKKKKKKGKGKSTPSAGTATNSDATPVQQNFKRKRKADSGNQESEKKPWKRVKSNEHSSSNASGKKKFKNHKADFKFSNDKNNRKVESEISDDRLKAYGINPKRYKNKLKYGPKQS